MQASSRGDKKSKAEKKGGEKEAAPAPADPGACGSAAFLAKQCQKHVDESPLIEGRCA